MKTFEVLIKLDISGYKRPIMKFYHKSPISNNINVVRTHCQFFLHFQTTIKLTLQSVILKRLLGLETNVDTHDITT